MSQMYEVAFQAHFANVVDIGKVIVCAPSQEGAVDMAITLLELPRSVTRCEVRRIKPSIWQLERREISKDDGSSRKNTGGPRPITPFSRFHLQIDAVISARSEFQVIRRVAEALLERVSGRKTQDTRNQALDIIVDCKPLHESAAHHQQSTLERIEIFGARAAGRVQGGQVRGK
jgi:hypothetical protein